ncbi:unnamed protein product [Hydatigera taeniaeformis]|uniref:Fungal_trans domain-containing protein n=1 Tax=Hydatigena taeniaeformis TaxID=6205 RepID=A0A0R3WHK5_HYDTA|nr:unnamed protein product [Hydatigera taeniaeformis]
MLMDSNTFVVLDGQASLWLRLNESCLNILTTFITGLNKANKQLTTEHFSMNGKWALIRTFRAHLLFDRSLDLPNASDSFSRLPIFRYFMREIPFAPTWRLFSSGGTNQVVDIWSTTQESHQTGQAVIWATEILGILTLSSYTEDRLGTVQSSLGRILSTIDESLEGMELHFNLVGLSLSYGGLTASKFGTHCQIPSPTVHEKENARTIDAYRYASDINLPWRIHATLRWALVSCVRRFGDHLRYEWTAQSCKFCTFKIFQTLETFNFQTLAK